MLSSESRTWAVWRDLSNPKASVIYPNSPLRDVACELRFPGEPVVETKRDEFFEKIRSGYPRVLVPNAQAGVAPALQHYRFQSDDRVRTISVALNSLAFSETTYSGHQSFATEFERLAGLFFSCFRSIQRLVRVGWRYVNFIPVPHKGTVLPVGEYLKESAEFPDAILAGAKTFDVQVEALNGDLVCRLHLASATGKAAESAQASGILLDVDTYSTAGGLDVGNFAECLRQCRETGKRRFESFITDNYREFLLGEEL